MLTIRYQTAFKKDYKRIVRRGYDVRLLEEVNNRLNYTINRKLHDEVRAHLAKLKGTP